MKLQPSDLHSYAILLFLKSVVYYINIEHPHLFSKPKSSSKGLFRVAHTVRRTDGNARTGTRYSVLAVFSAVRCHNKKISCWSYYIVARIRPISVS